jgi:PAS domain S-box-containing protein
MKIVSRLSIRTKIALLMTFVLAIVSIAVYLYFPRRLHEQIVGSVVQKSAALTEMAATSVADGLATGNRSAVAAALTGIRSNPDLVYFVLVDQSGAVFASYNELVAQHGDFRQLPMTDVLTPPRALQAGEVLAAPPREVIGGFTPDGHIYQTMAPVRHHGRVIGRFFAGMSLDGAHADAAKSRATIALVTMIAFLLGTIAVFALSTVITNPLQRIVDTTRGIAAGDLSKRADVSSSDEVGQLAESFNAMVEQLEDWNRTLEARVEERTHDLTASEERYRLLFERNLAGAYIAFEDGTLVDCNEACAKLFGYDSRAEFLASGRIDYMRPHERDSVIRRLREESAVANEEVELRGVWALENVRRTLRSDG